MKPSLYNAILNAVLTSGGVETTVSVNTMETLDGEVLSMSYLSPFTKGYIIVDPLAQFGTQPEIISFTGIDTTNLEFTGCIRGLSSVTTGVVAANVTYHGTGTPVIISWGAQDISDLITYINSLISGANGNATGSVYGLTKLTQDPAITNTPIAVGVNTSLSGTAISTTNKAVDQAYIATQNNGYAADAGSTDTYAITLSPVPAAYTAGMAVRFKANTLNTGAATLNVNALGAKTIKKNFNADLVTGDILAGQFIEVIYDGTNFQLLSPSSLGTIVGNGTGTHDLSVNGTDTIPHGLGKIPKLVRVAASSPGNGSSGNTCTWATSTYANSVQASVITAMEVGTSTVSYSSVSAMFLQFASNSSVGSNVYSVAAITVDATNIYIAWTKNGSASGSSQYVWDALA